MIAKDLNNERELLIKIAKGNQHAFRLVFDKYRSKIYSYSLKILKSENAAEEVVQDVFLNLWSNRETLVHIQNLGGYLRRSTRNCALDDLRKIARETTAYSIKNIDWQEGDQHTEKLIHFKEIQESLNKALDSLSPQQKLIYTLCKIDGMKHIEVAQQLNISIQTVRTHLKIANQAIKKLMQSHYKTIFLIILLSVNQ
ncbi:RNA polymerase sigma factor [Mucilaginibacter sp. KACC 22063]|uniref:RNA polymerase sigma factor n=1 Tax=Mucilaginibacter sp. KACC 22063 TaxID=3025666 RepID=UPI002365C2CB|nr:RNA polymerase sigma-70 factor [Mucilaginibacter sp. KACC 22063]WDF55829.1 RNA polymerase sigma-70 factor [Mucilaginibacter sp. KACC 22063]